MLKVAYDNIQQRCDLVRASGGNLDTDEGLEASVLISLFTDRRIDGHRGWWGDAFAAVVGHETGSRVWTFARAKGTAEDKREARAAIIEALQWYVEDGIATAVDCEIVSWASDVLAFVTSITRPDEVAPKWRRSWEVTFGLR